MQQKITIKKASPKDAEAFSNMQKELAEESEFLLLTVDEVQARSIKNQKKIFENMTLGKIPGCVFLAYINEEIAGFLG